MLLPAAFNIPSAFGDLAAQGFGGCLLSHRDGSLVAGWQLIPRDGTAAGVRVAPSFPGRDAAQVGFSSCCIPWALPCCGGSAPGKGTWGTGGICVKPEVLGNKVMLGLRAAGCRIPRVPVLPNKGMTKENDGF